MDDGDWILPQGLSQQLESGQIGRGDLLFEQVTSLIGDESQIVRANLGRQVVQSRDGWQLCKEALDFYRSLNTVNPLTTQSGIPQNLQ